MRFEPLPSPFDDVVQWGAVDGNWSFVISRQSEGWSASYADVRVNKPTYIDTTSKGLEIPRKSTDIGAWAQFTSREQAESACRHKLKELRGRLN